MAPRGRHKGPRHRAAKALGKSYRGFPWAYDGKPRSRRIARDVWGLLENEVRTRLPKKDRPRATAFIGQAFEYFSAATTQMQLSRPLLYYYAFLNLGKAALAIEGVPFPDRLQHGLTPKYGNTLSLKSHGVEWFADKKGDQAFAKFCRLFSHNRSSALTSGYASVQQLLASIPCIHRAYSQVAGTDEAFLLGDTELLTHGARAWWRLRVPCLGLNDSQKAWVRGLPTRAKCAQVTAYRDGASVNDVWDFESETRTRRGPGRNTDLAARDLARNFRREVRPHVILEAKGYRSYVGDVPVALPQWCVGLAALFYLGSLTRYRPHQYDAATGDFSWAVGEMLDSLPEQMLYLLASSLCGTEVVRPFAVGVQPGR